MRRDHLPARKRLAGRGVDLVERPEQLLLVHLRGGKREREPVPVPDGLSGRVPETGELANILGHRRPDRLRCLPGLAPLDGIVAVPKDPLDLVVIDTSPGDDAAMREKTISTAASSSMIRLRSRAGT